MGSLRDFDAKRNIPSTLFGMDERINHYASTVQENGILHHDIKPDNILFTIDHTIKITDFGIANTLCGTITYMSPEALVI